MADESLPAPLMTPQDQQASAEDQARAQIMAIPVASNTPPETETAAPQGLGGAPADPSYVNVRDPDTKKIGSIPRAQLAEAQAQGYQPVTRQEAIAQLKHEKYDTLGQQAKTFAEGALDAGTFGLSTGVETGLGIASPEDIQGRREENPISHGAGQVAGLVGSSLLIPGGGAAGLLEKGGLGAAKAVGLGAEAAFAETANAARMAGLTAKEAAQVARATGAQAFSTGARVASAAVKSAAEGMLLQAGDEVSKAFSDPEQSVGRAVADVGLGGLIGGATGAFGQGVGELWHARKGASTSGALNDLLNKASNGAEISSMLETMEPAERKAFLSASQAESELSALTDPEKIGAQEQGFLDQVSQLKDNADEITAATHRLSGEAPSPGMVSKSRLVQNMESDITQRGTTAGQKRAAQQGRIIDGASSKVEDLFEGSHNVRSTEGNAYSVSQRVEESIASTVEKERSYFKKEYGGYRDDFKNMDLSPTTRKKAVAGFLDNPDLRFAEGSDAFNAAQRIAKNMSKLENVEHVMDMRTAINKELSGAIRNGDGSMIGVFQEAKKTLSQLREDGMTFATKATGIGKQAGSISSERIAALRDLDARYALHKQDLMALGQQMGIGNVSGMNDLATKIAKNRNDEKFLKNIFNAKNFDGIKYFEKSHPEAFEEARRYKLGEMFDNATDKSGKFRLSSALREVEAIKNPDVLKLLFKDSPKAEQVLNDARTVLGAIPENSNPSGSGSYIARMGWLSPNGAKQNIQDAIQYSLSEMVPKLQQYTGGSKKAVELASLTALKSGAPIEPTAFKRLVDYAQKTIQGETKLAQASKSIFSKGPLVLGEKLSSAAREKLEEKLQALEKDPSPLFDVGQGTALYAPDHGAAMAQTAASAVNYLNSIRPVSVKKNLMDSESVINPVAKANYNRALDIAHDPTVVLRAVKQGAVTTSDLKHLTQINPGFYKAAAQKIQTDLANHLAAGGTIPYQARLGISTFLGHPLDSSMEPLSIQAAQPKTASAPQQPAQGGVQMPKNHSMKALDKMAGQYQTSLQAREKSRGSGR